jgi:hypothetical protein
MKKYTWILPCLALTFSMIGCQEESALNANVSPDDAIASRSPNALPFHGTFETVSTVIAPPPMLQQEISGSGQAPHLGQSTFTASSSVNMTGAPPFALNGTAVFVAANGDELWACFTGTVTPNGQGANDVAIDYTVTGGTGRFDDASGSFTGSTVAVPGLQDGELTLDGTISY